MIKHKELYSSPTVDTLELRIESGILIVSGQENTIEDAVNDDWGTL